MVCAAQKAPAEDNGLKGKWANLLANGLAEKATAPRALTPKVLRELEPAEVLMLDRRRAVQSACRALSPAHVCGRASEWHPGTVCVNLEAPVSSRPEPPSAVQTVSGVESL